MSDYIYPMLHDQNFLNGLISLAAGIMLNLLSFAWRIFGRLLNKNQAPMHVTIIFISLTLIVSGSAAVFDQNIWTLGAFFAVAFIAAVRFMYLGVLLSRTGIRNIHKEVSSGFDYKYSLNLCNNELSFAGIGASKLTELKEFESAVERCTRHDKETVRLLLSPPDHDVIKAAERNAGQAPNTYSHKLKKSLKTIKKLKENYNISVRFYRFNGSADYPYFRIMIIDNKLCALSYNVFGKGDGTKFPQIVFSKDEKNDYSNFYYAFNEYFRRAWENADEWDFERYLD